MFVSLTRLRLRSVRYLPVFVVHALRSGRQCREAPGCREVKLLADRSWTYWTLTGWDSQAAMRGYMTSGAHRRAMPKLLNWCDQASVAHWTQDEALLPAWSEADRQMRTIGRPSKLRHPAAGHADLRFAPPRRS